MNKPPIEPVPTPAEKAHRLVLVYLACLRRDGPPKLIRCDR